MIASGLVRHARPVIVLLTAFNCRGVEAGKWIQNVFTVAKLALFEVIPIHIPNQQSAMRLAIALIPVTAPAITIVKYSSAVLESRPGVTVIDTGVDATTV